jgi:hypothetical protein
MEGRVIITGPTKRGQIFGPGHQQKYKISQSLRLNTAAISTNLPLKNIYEK